MHPYFPNIKLLGEFMINTEEFKEKAITLDLILEKLLDIDEKLDKILCQKNNEEVLLTQKQAAKLLNRTEQTLIKWRAKGIINARIINRSVYYNKKELQRDIYGAIARKTREE
jgi:hypothetical protein